MIGIVEFGRYFWKLSGILGKLSMAIKFSNIESGAIGVYLRTWVNISEADCIFV
jgi:hypothetical protein